MSEYLDRKQVIDLYEKHHSHLATHVWEFGQELKQLPITTIPVAELDTTNDFAEWIDVNGDGSIMKCSRCGEKVCCKDNNFCQNCGARMTPRHLDK